MHAAGSNPPPPRVPTAVRTDIQALRAFAVLAVVLFHFWPLALPGGYIGVDVFFVISGFLITGQIVRSREAGTLRLGSFWAARARRLLPASLVVLAVSVVLTLLWAPATVQGQYLRSIIGSALYVENWLLAADGVDYLAHDNQPPIAQHYWSLSVEEQFYVLWPLLIMLVTLGASRSLHAKRRSLVVAVVAVIVLGFVASTVLTAVIYPYGYFSTVSRIWQFGVGALVALAPQLRLPRAARAVAWFLSLGALTATLFLYGTGTPFPGPAAALPVLATALFIAIGPEAPFSFLGRAVALKPVQWLGDQSYGIYLWHWPLIVIAPWVLGRPADLPENLILLGATILLAAVVKRFVEDPIRFGARTKRARPRSIALVTIAAMVAVVAGAAVPIWQNSRAAEERQAVAVEQIADPALCQGAHLLLEAGCSDQQQRVNSADELVPTLAGLMEDTGGAYACYDSDTASGAEPDSCSFGAEGPAAVNIAIHGDSHGAMLVPGLRSVAEERGWRFTTFVGRGCVWQQPAAAGCEARNDVLESHMLSGEYDALLVTAVNSTALDEDDRGRIARGYARAWEAAQRAGVPVIVLADNPTVAQSNQDCVAQADELALETCAIQRADSLLDVDPLRDAAELAPAELIDLSDAYCTDDLCPMQLGSVLVYRDLHHITATFSQSLAPYLADGIAAALERSGTRSS